MCIRHGLHPTNSTVLLSGKVSEAMDPTVQDPLIEATSPACQHTSILVIVPGHSSRAHAGYDCAIFVVHEDLSLRPVPRFRLLQILVSERIQCHPWSLFNTPALKSSWGVNSDCIYYSPIP